MRKIAAVAVFLLAGAAPAFAQTTYCNGSASNWTCSTPAPMPQPQPLPPIKTIDAGSLLNAWRAGREEREREERMRQKPPQPVPPVSNDVITTGNGLFATCSRDDDMSGAICTTFIRGVLGGYIGAQAQLTSRPRICITGTITGLQMRDIMVKWLRDHPEMRHEPAEAHVIVAMQSAFACP